MQLPTEILQAPLLETLGDPVDITVLDEETWIMNTEVLYSIQKMKGRFHVIMLFFSIFDQLKLVVRHIDHYNSRQKAEIYAKIFQRGIRKDPRGTLTRNNHAYDICDN